MAEQAIRFILEAELGAQKTIEEAARRRTDISAAAKRSAVQEITVYQDGLQHELEQKRTLQSLQSSGEGDAEDQARSRERIAAIETTRSRNEGLVISALLEKVLTVKVPTVVEGSHGEHFKTLYQHE
eukprot:TRINITY_DN47153_c0_g1_i1.p1 TRINITY_DN47153_c0_g1~~TRINITY_DN47153_c0_g1_i1.p1  ORF type:complete len:127 (+),score=62.87 TRINITY_DN47153_c0_g1_i1:66-446(+)